MPLTRVDASAGPVLLTQAQYARRVGVSRQAVGRQVAEGLIPTHGPRRLIDPAEADAWYAPRLDAGWPQARVPAAAVDWAAVRADIAGWRAWASATAGRLARTLGTDEAFVVALLGAALEEHLLLTGRLAAELDAGG